MTRSASPYETVSIPSPSTTSEALSPSSGPSRKRPRSEVTSEDRKEARAHRNRIAAQNSRDRRKAQFSYLERRVSELEEENRQLKAGMGISSLSTTPAVSEQSSRDKENEELRERIRTLEKGWDAVVKALASQGLPTGLTPMASSPEAQATQSAELKTISPSVDASSTINSSTFPLSPAPSHTSLDSSLDFDMTVSPGSLFSSSDAPSSSAPLEESDRSTRHLARVASIGPRPVPQQRVDLISPPSASGNDSSAAQGFTYDARDTISSQPPVDDATMEDLFREILAPSPTTPSTDLPVDTISSTTTTSTSPSEVRVGESGSSMLFGGVIESQTSNEGALWANEDLQRLLNLLPGAIDVCGEADVSNTWDSISGSVVGVF